MEQEKLIEYVRSEMPSWINMAREERPEMAMLPQFGVVLVCGLGRVGVSFGPQVAQLEDVLKEMGFEAIDLKVQEGFEHLGIRFYEKVVGVETQKPSIN